MVLSGDADEPARLGGHGGARAQSGRLLEPAQHRRSSSPSCRRSMLVSLVWRYVLADLVQRRGEGLRQAPMTERSSAEAAAAPARSSTSRPVHIRRCWRSRPSAWSCSPGRSPSISTGNVVGTTMEEQAEAALANCRRQLASAGCDFRRRLQGQRLSGRPFRMGRASTPIYEKSDAAAAAGAHGRAGDPARAAFASRSRCGPSNPGTPSCARRRRRHPISSPENLFFARQIVDEDRKSYGASRASLLREGKTCFK